jgi:hypothetical protein
LRRDLLRYRSAQCVRINRLREQLVVLRLLRVLAQIETADQDRPQRGILAEEMIAQREAIHRLHDYIGDEQVYTAQLCHGRQRLFTGRGGAHVMARNCF